MCKRLLNTACAVALVFAAAAAVNAQDTPKPTTTDTQKPTTTTTVTTQTTQAVQNADGTWTVIEYPANKEVVVDLTPGLNMTAGATGRAKVHRMADHTMLHLDLSGVTGVEALNLYAVDPAGRPTLLGPLTIHNGTVSQDFRTPLDKFMLVLSPEASLTTMADNTPVLFRSAVPQGFAVVPTASRDREDGAVVGEKVSAVSTSGGTSAYSVPMLNVPGMKRGDDSEIKVNLTGALTGSRVNFKIEPRKDGPVSVTARFHELKESPAGQVFVLWAVSPDNKFTKLGQVVNTGRRNEAEIKSETTLTDFGLLITLEAPEATTPAGAVVGTIIRN
ncbi:MAG TPA: hypothetical protein VF240_05055 [Pyrinomonadaceae bacterium]